MKILYIEDERNKAHRITSWLRSSFPNAQIDEKNSYTSGLLAIAKLKYDLLLLDMSLPLFDVFDVHNDQMEFETFAGLDILEEMKRKSIKTPTIVITAFDILDNGEKQLSLLELNAQMKEEFEEIYIGAIHYDVSSITWKNKLLSLIKDEVKLDNENNSY